MLKDAIEKLVPASTRATALFRQDVHHSLFRTIAQYPQWQTNRSHFLRMLYGGLQSGRGGFPWVSRDIPQLTLVAYYNVEDLHAVAMESDSFGMTLQLCATAVHYLYFVLERMLAVDLTLETEKFTLALTEMADVFNPRTLSCEQGAEQTLWHLQHLLGGVDNLLYTTQLNDPYAPVSEPTAVERFAEVAPISFEDDSATWYDDDDEWDHLLRSGTSYPPPQQQQGSGFYNRSIPDEDPTSWLPPAQQYRFATSAY